MEQKILKVGDVIEFNGKKYRAESEAESGSCRGCAFDDATSCPIKSEDCSATSLIFKEVKETPRRHIELGVVKVEGDKVTFRIVEQTHRCGDFSQQIDPNIFKASNGIRLSSRVFSEWKDDNHLQYCRGSNCEKDDKELNCTAVDFAKISEAVSEYNITGGKGYKKLWPKKGDRYFFISGDITPSNLIFTDCAFDHNCQTCCNIFRTYKEAEAAADKVRALLKELAEK